MFSLFETEVQDLSKESLLKFMFTWRFNKEMRRLNSQLRLKITQTMKLMIVVVEDREVVETVVEAEIGERRFTDLIEAMDVEKEEDDRGDRREKKR